jgi:hypothetical protein
VRLRPSKRRSRPHRALAFAPRLTLTDVAVVLALNVRLAVAVWLLLEVAVCVELCTRRGMKQNGPATGHAATVTQDPARTPIRENMYRLYGKHLPQNTTSLCADATHHHASRSSFTAVHSPRYPWPMGWPCWCPSSWA